MSEISSVTDAALAATVHQAATRQDRAQAPDRELTRSVAAAVQTLNNAGIPGEGREVTFSLDQATKRPVVKVVLTSTKEVLQQWPPEYLLQLAADTKKLTRDSGCCLKSSPSSKH